MEVIFRMAAVGVAVAIINQILSKADKDEYTLFTTIAGLIVVLLMFLPEFDSLKDTLSGIIEF